MASYKSHYHFSPPTRPDSGAPSTQRAPSISRLPTRSITPTSQPQVRPPPPPPPPSTTPSKLQKKKVNREDAKQSSRAFGTKKSSVAAPSAGEKSRQQSSRVAPGMSLPRYAAPTSSSSARLPRYEGVSNTRTPSLVSGSSVSTIESPRSVLRRKPSSIGRQTAPVISPEPMSSQEELPVHSTVVGGYNDPFSETVLGITLPPSAPMLAAKELAKDIPNGHRANLELPPRLATENLPPPTPLYAISGTPSTRYSESPTSISYISTPTSMSSHSPGTASSHKAPQRLRQTSPLHSRPPVTRRKFDEVPDGRESRALSSVRESSTSSSSASTVRMLDTIQKELAREPLPAPPPSPPASLTQPMLESTESRQIPPEFAHLADPVQERPVAKRPVRPSRDGTPDISALRQQSPIIQSNMTSLPSHHRRQSSTGSRLGMSGSTSRNGSATRLAMSSKIPSRNPSPNPNYTSTFPPRSSSRTASSRGPTPDMTSDSEKKATKGKSLTTPSPSTKSSSRFGFFSRRAKTEPIPQTTTTTKQEKRLRKGPAAGTGHEGYGRFALRGRSGSTTSGTGSIGRSASADSVGASLERTSSSRKSSITSQPVDDYFLDRLTPVVIRGTGSSTDLCRSPEQLQSTSSLDSTLNQVTPDPSYEQLAETSIKPEIVATRPALLPSALPDSARTGSPMKRFGLGIRRGSESEEETKSGFLPALATRRSFRRSQLFGGKEQQVEKLSIPTNSPAGASTDSLASPLSRQVSGPSQTEGYFFSGMKDGGSASSKKSPAQPKPPRKWNFFQRTQVTSPKKATFAERHEASAVLTAPSRSVAHYALDSVDDQVDVNELETIMKAAKAMSKEPARNQPVATPTDQRLSVPKNRPIPEHAQSILLPSPPMLPQNFTQSTRPASPQVTLSKEHTYTSPSNSHPTLLPELHFSPEPHFEFEIHQQQFTITSPPVAQTAPSTSVNPVAPTAPAVPALPPAAVSSSGRPSRLQQVGRIPQVVSQRDRERKRSNQSFSRPFAPSQPRPSSSSGHIPRPSVDSVHAPLLAEAAVISEAYPAYSGLSSPFSQTTFEFSDSNEDNTRTNQEFISFPPRKRKDSEMSSSSSGFHSIQAPAAVIPPPGAPPGEDEVWNEYDDLIDEVLSPRLSPQREASGGSPSANAMHSASNSVSSNSNTASVHLRRSRLLSALHAASPVSSLSISDFLAAYGDSHLSVVDSVTGRLSLPSTHRTSTDSGPVKSIRISLPLSLAEEKRLSRSTIASETEKQASSKYGDSKLMEIAEAQGDNGAAMADLRFGALMTSKWLSFGRVLFSPIHFELKDPAEDRILVIDGLGKDWSYYCALTYSEASVYNLGPSPDNSATSTSTPWSTLPNHRHIHHPSMTAPFPFPRGFFAAVVYRFPLATSENLYRSAISECKRVLRPGGYLELSVLDIELLNMGNRARRAVRGLKVQMQVAEPGVCLKPVSDLVMKLFGRKGFENINRCIVGVPVAAGRLGSWSSDSSADEVMSTSKRTMVNGNVTGSRVKQNDGGVTKPGLLNAPQPSFTDLLTTPPSPDPAVAATADANITDMVARVGRWWYSRCYESIVLPNGDDQAKQSIWADGKLLRECEKRGTGFRLLVAYAQKPNCAVRRTVSV